MLAVLLILAVADPSTTPSDASNPFVAYGLLGVILVAVVGLWLTGQVVSGREHTRVVNERDQLARDLLGEKDARLQQMKESNEAMRLEILPITNTVTMALTRMGDQVAALVDVSRRGG